MRKSTRTRTTSVAIPSYVAGQPAKLIVPYDPARIKVIIWNTSGMNDVTVGEAEVKPTLGTNGLVIAPGAPPATPGIIPSRLELETSAPLYGVSAGAGLIVMEILE